MHGNQQRERLLSAFTFIRNAIRYDFPIVESINSILPICHEYVVCVGRSEDGTLELIRSIGSPKIRIVESVWDDSLRQGGRVLALETDKALDAVSPESPWAFYLQGDEVVHEKYLEPIVQAAERYRDDERVEGLLFDYRHFYGNYKYVADSRNWYRREVRIIRNNKHIRSWGDAQGFRMDSRKLNVKPVPAEIYHYGWVKNPQLQGQKTANSHRYWHSDEWIRKNVPDGDFFDYANVDSVALFGGTHPKVMMDRIARLDWDFEFDTNKKSLNFKNRLLYRIERLTGRRPFEYRNYNVI